MSIGRLYGLGVGPGDPELITLKAVRLLRAASVVAYPAPETGESFARAIAAQWIEPHQREFAIRFPMKPGPVPAAIYDTAATAVATVLDRGEDVAFLCQGDPLFYGSFAGILDRLAPHYPVTIVPGVSSLTACAAAALAPLVQRDECLTIIPATLPKTELARRLAETDGGAAIIKLGRHFTKLYRILATLGRLDDALYVERASLPEERIAPLATIDPKSVPYFAMALLRSKGASRQGPHPL
jgi:precorrin-2/cobalt-factor-2 C20-methyltransferase